MAEEPQIVEGPRERLRNRRRASLDNGESVREIHKKRPSTSAGMLDILSRQPKVKSRAEEISDGVLAGHTHPVPRPPLMMSGGSRGRRRGSLDSSFPPARPKTAAVVALSSGVHNKPIPPSASPPTRMHRRRGSLDSAMPMPDSWSTHGRALQMREPGLDPTVKAPKGGMLLNSRVVLTKRCVRSLLVCRSR